MIYRSKNRKQNFGNMDIDEGNFNNKSSDLVLSCYVMHFVDCWFSLSRNYISLLQSIQMFINFVILYCRKKTNKFYTIFNLEVWICSSEKKKHINFVSERDPLDISASDLALLQSSQHIELVVEDDDCKYLLVVKITNIWWENWF